MFKNGAVMQDDGSKSAMCHFLAITHGLPQTLLTSVTEVGDKLKEKINVMV